MKSSAFFWGVVLTSTVVTFAWAGESSDSASTDSSDGSVHHPVNKALAKGNRAASETATKTHNGLAAARDSADAGLGAVKSGVHEAGSSVGDAGDKVLGKVSDAIHGN